MGYIDNYGRLIAPDELYHFGIKGMHWGIRRYQPYPSDYHGDGKFTGKTFDSQSFTSSSGITAKRRKDPALARALSKILPGARATLESARDYDLVDKNGKKIGNLSVNKDSKDSLNVNWINISNKNRGQGHAQSVMKAVIENAKKDGYKEITLEVPGESPDARHIYEKLGFREHKVLSEDDVWGGLTSMKLDLMTDRIKHSDELYHHGIKGMHWGIRRYQPYPSDYHGDGKYKGKKASAKDSRESSAVSQKDRTEYKKNSKAKKALKIGAIVAGTAIAAYAVTHPEQTRAVIDAGKRASKEVFSSFKKKPTYDNDSDSLERAKAEGLRYVNQFFESINNQGAVDATRYWSNGREYHSINSEKLKMINETNERIKKTMQEQREAVAKAKTSEGTKKSSDASKYLDKLRQQYGGKLPRSMNTYEGRVNLKKTLSKLSSKELAPGWSERFRNWLEQNPNYWSLPEDRQFQMFDWR